MCLVVVSKRIRRASQEANTYEADHVEDAVLDWMSAVDGELQVKLLLLGCLGSLLDWLSLDCFDLLFDVSFLSSAN